MMSLQSARCTRGSGFPLEYPARNHLKSCADTCLTVHVLYAEPPAPRPMREWDTGKEGMQDGVPTERLQRPGRPGVPLYAARPRERSANSGQPLSKPHGCRLPCLCYISPISIHSCTESCHPVMLVLHFA